MLLSARLLKNCVNVNSFEPATNIRFTQGDNVQIFLQLIDLEKDRANDGYAPFGKRYVAASGAVLNITIPNIVTAPNSLVVTKVATQPFAGDQSIWSFQVFPTDGLVGTYSLQLVLVEGAVTTNGRIDNALNVNPVSATFA